MWLTARLGQAYRIWEASEKKHFATWWIRVTFLRSAFAEFHLLWLKAFADKGGLKANRAEESPSNYLTFISVTSDEDVNALQVGACEHRHGIRWHELAVDGRSGGEAENSGVRVPLLNGHGLGVDWSHAIKDSSWRFLEENNCFDFSKKTSTLIKLIGGRASLFLRRSSVSTPQPTFNIVALQLQSSISISPTCTAFSAVMWLQGAFRVPDCRIPRDTRPRVTGDKRCKLTLPPPAKTSGTCQFQITKSVCWFIYLHFRLHTQITQVECQGWANDEKHLEID